jgi:RHS repeat-associated protein
LSEVTSYAFDQLNRVKTVTDPVLNATNITYSTDTRNLPSLVVDPLGFHTTYAYDGFGELTTLGSQDTGTTTYTYDNAGNVKTKQDANGKTTTYTAYDSLNRIGTATYQDATTSNYYYDHNANSIGRLWQLADPTPTYPAGQPANTTYVDYDLYGNVTGKYNQLTGQTSYSTFDPNTNQLTTETYPSGMLVAYKYDAAGQMNRFDINGSWFIHNATHQPFGPVSGWTWGNGTSTAYTRTFDLDGRLTGYPLDGTNTRTVGYDGASRVTSINDSVATQSIGYDADSRITSYTGPYGNGSFSGVTYDANGNRTSIAYSSATETDTIDTVSNFLQQTKLGTAAAITYTPDAAGNTTAIGSSTTYSYDARNRQNGEVFGAYSTNWFYDGLGDRIEKYTPPPGQLFRVAFASAGTELTSTRELGSYFYGGPTYGNLTLQETIYLDHAGTAAQFGAIPVGVQPTGTTSAHPWTTARAYTDQQGSVRRLTDLSLNLYGKWDTDPFGVGQWNYSPAGFSTLYYDQRFPGQSANDAGGTNDTTSYFNTTRNYVQGTGRYMQSDSIGLAGTTPGSMSTYPYVGSNPANGIDPDGRFGPIGFVIGAGVGGVAGYATGGWRGAAVGAVTGGVVGIVAPEASAAAGGGAAGALAFAGTSAVGAGAGTVALNLWSGKPLSEGMCTSAALAATAPVLSGEALLAGGGVISESVIEGRLASTVLGINTTIFGTSGELMFSRAAPLMSPAPRPIRSDFGDRTLFPAGAPMVR